MDALPVLIGATVIVQGLGPRPPKPKSQTSRAVEGRRRRSRSAAKRRYDARVVERREAAHDAGQAAREAEARLICTDPLDRMICEGLCPDDRALALELIAAGTHDIEEAIAHAWAQPGERWFPGGTARRKALA